MCASSETNEVQGRFVAPAPIEWFYLVAGLFVTMAYFWLLDDAFVYFRYVDNLLFLRIGLVYNQGEYVEGFSSPLWACVLTALRATHMSYMAILQLLTGGSFVLFWFLLVQLNRRLSPNTPVVNFPLAYLAFNYGVLSYFSSGHESPFVQVIAVVYALYIVNPRSRGLQYLVGLSPMIRPELLLPLLLCAVWGWYRSKKPPYRLLATAAVLVGAWQAFRICYYADLYPNTFYLKNMFDPAQGVRYVHGTLYPYYFYEVCLFSLLVVVLLIHKRGELKLPVRLMMIAAAAPVLLYVIKIGGDARHYRYMAFPFVLGVCALSGNIEHFQATYIPAKYRRYMPWAGVVVACLAFSLYPRQLDKHPFLCEATNRGVHGIADADGHRHRPELHVSNWRKRVNIEKLTAYRKSQTEFEYDGILGRGWCVGNYEQFNLRIIHSLGLTDAILARTIMPADRPAHKFGLKALAQDMVKIQQSARTIGPGMYRKAVDAGQAPEWIADNLATIEIIEKKIYNTHNLFENLRLAFVTPPPIVPAWGAVFEEWY